MKPLSSRQTTIGWDNLLRGKLDKEWRIQQYEYEALENIKQKDRNIKRILEHGIILNPCAHDKEKNKHRKKKKKSKDVFQHLIERIFIITEEDIWKQRNLDRH